MTMDKDKSVYILGIESSCDDTSAAVMRDGILLSNVTASQAVHEAYGGVVPELASRAHEKNIVPVVDQALKQAGIEREQLSAIAFTRGPGLMGSLLVGVSFAKGLAASLGIPMIDVNHLQGHILAHFIHTEGDDYASPTFPFLCLLVSGGNSQIVLVKSYKDMEIIGQTIDDAAGEAIDKCSKVMELGYPGGPIIDRLARQGNPDAFQFSKPNIPGYDYSFSGLKTAVIHQCDMFWNDGFEHSTENMCAAFQETACRTLTTRLFRAVEDTGLKTVVAGGGVAANSRLRAILAERTDIQCIFPPLKLCGDNGAMIAGVAYHFLARGDRSGWDTTASARIPQFKRGLKNS